MYFRGSVKQNGSLETIRTNPADIAPIGLDDTVPPAADGVEGVSKRPLEAPKLWDAS